MLEGKPWKKTDIWKSGKVLKKYGSEQEKNRMWKTEMNFFLNVNDRAK